MKDWNVTLIVRKKGSGVDFFPGTRRVLQLKVIQWMFPVCQDGRGSHGNRTWRRKRSFFYFLSCTQGGGDTKTHERSLGSRTELAYLYKAYKYFISSLPPCAPEAHHSIASVRGWNTARSYQNIRKPPALEQQANDLEYDCYQRRSRQVGRLQTHLCLLRLWCAHPHTT